MSKSYTLILAFSVFSISVFSQKSKSPQEPSNTQTLKVTDDPLYIINEKMYRSSLQFGDYQVAKQSLYAMIAIKPEATALKDTLALLYINMGQVAQALLVSKEILEKSPDNINIIEVKAVSEQNLGLSKDALATYESLYGKTKNVYHLYQIATLQYELKRMAECNQSIDLILATPEIEKKELNVSTGQRNQQQKVDLKSAVLNIKGVLAMELKENAIAKTLFEQALKSAPDFVLAKNNLEFVNSQLNPKQTTSTTPKSTIKK